jgi:carbamate kinase
VQRDGDRWRRVVASPDPKRIVQLDAIRRLVDGGFLVVCAGGGGIPVVEDTDWGARTQRAVRRATPDWLRAQTFAADSMGPKVEAVCRFVEATGGRAAIGRLDSVGSLVAGTAGTQVSARAPTVAFGETPSRESSLTTG